jgi:5-bromo-4-chloroindolyl phosphate hydrolysis protein
MGSMTTLLEVLSVITLIFVFVTIDMFVIYTLAKRITRPKITAANRELLERLNQRLVSGEINDEEYRHIKNLLSEAPSAEKAKRTPAVRLSDDGELIDNIDGFDGGSERAEARHA